MGGTGGPGGGRRMENYGNFEGIGHEADGACRADKLDPLDFIEQGFFAKRFMTEIQEGGR